MKLEAHGVSIDVPPRWEGAIESGRPEDVGASRRVTEGLGARPRESVGTVLPALHLASVPLPPQRGDFGAGVVSRLTQDDVFLAVLLYGDEDAGTALFQRPLPRTVRGDELHPRALQRIIPGQYGLQVFCSEGGRPLCLYVVAGQRARRSEPALRALNDALASLVVGR